MILRHPHGRGELHGDSEANLSTYISRNSSAHDESKLRDCRLLSGSRAEGRAQVYGGEFWFSVVKGKTIVAGSPMVIDSVLDCSEVSGQPRLVHVEACGTTEICDKPRLIGADARRLRLCDATIYGSPDIQGDFTVTGRVHEGAWTRAPKHIALPWCQLSECIEGKILLQCYCRPATWFLRFGHRLAAKWSWSDDMISVTMDTIRREFT